MKLITINTFLFISFLTIFKIYTMDSAIELKNNFINFLIEQYNKFYSVKKDIANNEYINKYKEYIEQKKKDISEMLNKKNVHYNYDKLKNVLNNMQEEILKITSYLILDVNNKLKFNNEDNDNSNNNIEEDDGGYEIVGSPQQEEQIEDDFEIISSNETIKELEYQKEMNRIIAVNKMNKIKKYLKGAEIIEESADEYLTD